MSDAILDAAREVFEAFGVRRANVDDIARRAGTSRSTLYRRYSSKSALLEAVLLQAYDEFLAELDRVARDLPPQEAVVECFVHGLALSRQVPVLARLAETEPESFAGIGHRSQGTMLVASAERVAATLRRSGARMPDDELLVASELLLRIAATYLVDRQGHLDVDDEDAVRHYAKRYLAQLVE